MYMVVITFFLAILSYVLGFVLSDFTWIMAGFIFTYPLIFVIYDWSKNGFRVPKDNRKLHRRDVRRVQKNDSGRVATKNSRRHRH